MDDTVLAWCKRLIGCRSVTNEGTRAIAELCARELIAPLGLEPRLLTSTAEGDAQVNLIAMIAGSDQTAAPLVFNTHLDTVPPGEASRWTECNGDPFNASVVEDRIYGLGAADTKLDFIAKVMALRLRPRPRRDVWLIATFGEEHGLVGAKEIAAAGLLPRGALAFIGEPSRLEVITAHKGLMVFELRIDLPGSIHPTGPFQRLSFIGRAAHSSTPALGRNAIRLAIATLATHPECAVHSIRGGDAVNKVPAHCEAIVARASVSASDEMSIEQVQDASESILPSETIRLLDRFIAELERFANGAGPEEEDYAAPTLTCNPGVIRSTSDSVTLEFELRPPPSLSLDRVREGVALIADKLDKSESLRIELRERRANPGFRSPLDSETVELAMAAMARANLPLKSGVKAGCTEAGIYAAAGLKPVVFGPGPSTGVIHAPNEYNFLSDVDGAIRFYGQLLR